MRYWMRRVGVKLIGYYYVKECLPVGAATMPLTLPEGFRCQRLTDKEIEVINGIGGHEAAERAVRNNESARRGDHCLGILRGDEIVAFGWAAIDVAHSAIYTRALLPNEAYLYNLFVIPEMRGHNVAGILRSQTYAYLQAMGKDTFYSITQVDNAASWRFKEKLGATKVFRLLYVDLFGRWKSRWIVRRY